MLIDGVRSQESLLNSVTGVGLSDFDQLNRLGLIASASISALSATPSATAAAPVSAPVPLQALDIVIGKTAEPPRYAQFTARLTQLISSELGLRGLLLTLAVEKAADVRELEPVAGRVLAEIARRKGDASASNARRTLYGV
ncbi:MAG: hypothetical protein QFE16_08635 [Pseudomonadota bacterium]|nr:hypothetical protein [Pseudomonadota bacterium]